MKGPFGERSSDGLFIVFWALGLDSETSWAYLSYAENYIRFNERPVMKKAFRRISLAIQSS